MRTYPPRFTRPRDLDPAQTDGSSFDAYGLATTILFAIGLIATGVLIRLLMA